MKTVIFTIKNLVLNLGLVLIGSILSQHMKANNVTISNFQYLTATQEIQFDITWENSWRNTGTTGSTQNYDGVWVFAKFRHSCAKDSVNPSASNYAHMWLANTGHSIPATASGELGATTIGGNSRNLGVFLYRAADGTGTFTLTGVKLKWDVTAQNITHTDWDVQVFAIEMVNIPQQSYYLGDGSSLNSFVVTSGGSANSSTGAFLVNSENAITCSQTVNGSLGIRNSNTTAMQGSLPAGFPKGFDAFWSMKYETTQKQYCDYLNTLSRANQGTAAPNIGSNLAIGNTSLAANSRGAFESWSTQRSSRRNSIRVTNNANNATGNINITIDPSKPVLFVCDLNELNAGNSADDGQSIACNMLTPELMFRYLDWIGLRPMNEMEFEKICRGTSVSPPYLPILNETIWGQPQTTSYTTSNNTLNNSGLSNEDVGTTAQLVYGVSTTLGPRRVGTTHRAGTTRVQAGSSYYGVADMAGNLSEVVISVSTFTSNHNTYTRDSYGDGEFNTVYTWGTSETTQSQNSIRLKGAHWYGTNYGSADDIRISQRYGSGTSNTSIWQHFWGLNWNNNLSSIDIRACIGIRGVRNSGTIIP
jgi:hypothetical protein